MISIEEYKKALGAKADDLTEERIIQMRDMQDALSELFFTMWLQEVTEKDVIIVRNGKTQTKERSHSLQSKFI
jgi:hypothetical protein